MVLLFCSLSVFAKAESSASRFFHSGDGLLTISSTHTKMTFKGDYRKPDGSYDQKAITRINKVLGGKIELRLVEYIDFLQDHFTGGEVTVISGFRSPDYNTKLRNKGKLAAKASLHQFGMAADLKISGVKSRDIWNFVREIRFGGVGHYGGESVHIDTGPARFWEQETSGVGTDVAENNKKIIVVTDRDIYFLGETMKLTFARMTMWPIGLDPSFVLEKKKGERWKEVSTSPLLCLPAEALAKEGKEGQGEVGCCMYASPQSMRDLPWKLPSEIESGRYRVTAHFCNRTWPEMPEEISTPEFEIQSGA